MTTPSTMDDGRQLEARSPLIEIDTNGDIRAVAFAANGDYLVSGGTGGARVWRVKDGELLASMARDVEHIRCLAVSRDCRWIAAGTYKEVIVWDTETYEHVFVHQEAYLNGVDFSPDSTQLVTGSLAKIASVWDVPARQRVLGPFLHQDIVIAARYSPNGTRIATATPNSVCVFDANDGRLIIQIAVKVSPWFNNGLQWSNEHLFVVSNSTIKQFDASTGSKTLEWSVPESNDSSCIALPRHGGYIAYATNHTVTVWDSSTCSELGRVSHSLDVCSLVLPPDDGSLAVAGSGGNIVIDSLARFNDMIPLSRLHPTFKEPDIQIEDAALDAWSRDQLENAEALLTAAIPTSRVQKNLALASRALVRTRLQEYDGAIADAEESIKLGPSVAGYIAKSIALVRKNKKYDGYRACDIAFERFHSAHVSFILLMRAIIVFMAGDDVDAISRVDDLIDSVQFNSICYVVQAYMYFLLGKSSMDCCDYDHAIQSFELGRTKMRRHSSRTLSVISLMTGWQFNDLSITIQRHLCEALYAAGRTSKAGESLSQMLSTADGDIYEDAVATTWISDFVQRCLSIPESNYDVVSSGQANELIRPVSPSPLLRVWAKLKLISGSWEDALSTAGGFVVPKFAICQAICERLETLDRIMDATECFHQLMRELGGEKNLPVERAAWVLDFRRHLWKKLEHRGDVALDAQRHDEAVVDYSAALSLLPASPRDLYTKRSKTYVAMGLCENALSDANEVVKLDPSSPWGYERKHAALHETGDYDNAIVAYETMLSKMALSTDPEIRNHLNDHVSPDDTRNAIRKAVKDAIRDLPRVLINTRTGRLCDKAQQASSFESLPVYKEMISSMTTSIDHTLIGKTIAQYYHYATFSHRWEDNEPLFNKVVQMIVYDLEESPTHDKLQMFCKIVQDAGYHWAWSDTCCVDKADHFVLQEALVAMFKWYEGSAVTIVYLRDVHAPSRRGDLVKSVWNTRSWTFQEYHAAKVIRFYTAEWKPYLDLDIPNHKDSPEIIAEMEEATGVSAQILVALRPGLEDIREKLCLASGREATLVEDAAYSLLGMFSASLPIMYGEGDKALGRLLAHLLTGSGDTSILAWTGKSGSFNSCLPASIAVFGEYATTHIPPAIDDAEMDRITGRLVASSLAQKLYDRLFELPAPYFAGKRMKLPCITFKLGPLEASQSKSERKYRAQATALGVVEIRTKEDLSRFESLYLVHPWIDFLLHRHPIGSGIEATTTPEGIIDDQCSSIGEYSTPGSFSVPPTVKRTRTSLFAARFGLRFGTQDTASLQPPSSVSHADRLSSTLQFLARLRQPFGALLFTPARRNVAEFRRVAPESRITVQLREDAPFDALIKDTRILDVL